VFFFSCPVSLSFKIINILETDNSYQLQNDAGRLGRLQKELVLVERLIFKFVWSKHWNKVHVCERKIRSVLKAELE
jgi:hypothetical protein